MFSSNSAEVTLSVKDCENIAIYLNIEYKPTENLNFQWINLKMGRDNKFVPIEKDGKPFFCLLAPRNTRPRDQKKLEERRKEKNKIQEKLKNKGISFAEFEVEECATNCNRWYIKNYNFINKIKAEANAFVFDPKNAALILETKKTQLKAYEYEYLLYQDQCTLILSEEEIGVITIPKIIKKPETTNSTGKEISESSGDSKSILGSKSIFANKSNENLRDIIVKFENMIALANFDELNEINIFLQTIIPRVKARKEELSRAYNYT